jgi:hypothetical protein
MSYEIVRGTLISKHYNTSNLKLEDGREAVLPLSAVCAGTWAERRAAQHKLEIGQQLEVVIMEPLPEPRQDGLVTVASVAAHESYMARKAARQTQNS